MRGGLSRCHPAAAGVYFLLVLGITMWTSAPLCLAFSLAGGLGWSVCLRGRRALRFALTGLAPAFFFLWLINPLFTHAGVTILAYLPGGNPLTLESILYGLAAAARLCAVMVWFSCVHEVLTADKLMGLFSRSAPSVSLLLTMVLRFVPRLRVRLLAVERAQAGLGGGASGQSLRRRIRSGVGVLSAMVSWSLEEGVETADAMRARGYGLPGRTAYTPYVFDGRSAAAAGAAAALGAVTVSAMARGDLEFRYYPFLRGGAWSLWAVTGYAAFLGLCALPLLMAGKEAREWKRSGRRG